jgi:outer membrane protein TolC
MITIRLMPIALLLGLVFFSSIAGATTEPALLEQLLAEADQKNPELLAARERAEMASYRIDQVNSLDDPMLGVGLVNLPIDDLSTASTPMTGATLTLTQKFPFPGKLAAKGEMAKQQTIWYRQAYEDARLKLRQQVKDAWYRLLYQRKAIELTNKNVALLDDFIRLTETRYQVGKGLQQHVLKAQVERSKLYDKLLNLQQKEESTLAELNNLVGRPTAQSLGEQSVPVLGHDAYTLERLQQQAADRRPLFAAYRSLIDRFEEQRKLARLNYKPDFKVWAGYRWRDNDLPDGGTDFISAGVSLNLPFENPRRAAAVAEADSGLRMAHQRYQDFRSQVDLAIHRSLARMEEAMAQTELYQTGIIPQADQTFKATLAAYQVDKVDFLDLLDSLLTLYRYEIDYFRALTDHERGLSMLVFAAGLEDEAKTNDAQKSHEGH